MEVTALIDEAKGNLLRADADALVNTVNCVGFMGKGIALQFKQAYPQNFDAYRRACKSGEVRPGSMFVVETGSLISPRYIINFPTKRHWRGNSRIEDIRSGLLALVREVREREIQSVALPPLGCGNGGLDWADVRPLIEAAIADAPDVRWILFAPVETPDAKSMPVRTARPSMTPARALFIKLIERYSVHSYRRSLLEIQKLAYLLQESGEPLRLKYEAGHYGPYADNLNKVLERIEGHFTRGYGDSQNPNAQIELLSGAVEEANAVLSRMPESRARLERVSSLIDGFETPYGMELLATVHWVVTRMPNLDAQEDAVIEAVHEWSPRKANTLQPKHIRIAYDRLLACGWLDDRRATADSAGHS